jgi:hypothetical protein
MTYYKFLKANRISSFQNFQYPEKDWTPKVEGKLSLCNNGYHGCTPDQLIHWIDEELWEVESQEEWKLLGADDNKVITRGGLRLVKRFETWNKQTARLFACDCAESVLKNFEDKYPDDKRPREAIATARRFALGLATEKELQAASSAAHLVVDSAYRSHNARLLEYINGQVDIEKIRQSVETMKEKG